MIITHHKQISTKKQWKTQYPMIIFTSIQSDLVLEHKPFHGMVHLNHRLYHQTTSVCSHLPKDNEVKCKRQLLTTILVYFVEIFQGTP